MSMNHKNLHIVAGLIFAIVAVLHAFRIVNGFDVVFGSISIPIWASWIGVVVGAGLSYLFFNTS